MTDELEYTSFELMAAAGARELKDGEIVGVGLGLPVVSSFLAKRTHAPNLTILLELGVVDPEPLEIGVDGLSDPRIWYRAKVHTSFADMLGSVLHKGLVDVGFLGGLEIDAYGNLNTTLLGDPNGKFRRFTGSGGGNDIASCARRTVVTIRHEARKLNEAVSFITSPGYLRGNGERERAGLVRRSQPGDHRQGGAGLRPRQQTDAAGIHPPQHHAGGCPCQYGFQTHRAGQGSLHRAADPRTGPVDPRGDRPRKSLCRKRLARTGY